MIQKVLKKLTKNFTLSSEELETLSKFLIDIAKGVLGVPLVIYLVLGFSPLVLAGMFVLDFLVVGICLIVALILHRKAKGKNYG